MSKNVSPLRRWIEGNPGGATWRRTTEALPADDATCGWIRQAPPQAPPRILEGEQEADYAVIGAGFAGLGAARRLAELAPDHRTVILDAQRAGHGAAGRSSGFVVEIAHFVARLKKEEARRYMALARKTIAGLHELSKGFRIDCDWDDEGWYHVAAGAAAEEDLRGLAGWIEEEEAPFRWLEAGDLATELGTTYYRAGIHLPGSVLVQPAALALGLAEGLGDESLGGAATLFEESPVLETRRAGDGGFVLRTPDGTLRARKLIVAANAYAPSLGFLGRRVLPLFSFGSLTRPLTPGEQESIGGKAAWGILAEDVMGSTLRRTRDQRILVRNLVDYRRDLRPSRQQRQQALEHHRRVLASRFPSLAEVPFETSWGGPLGVTPSRNFFVGEVAPDAWATGGYTGAGIVMGYCAGERLAELATGRWTEELEDILRLPVPGLLPPQPFLGIGASFRSGRMNAAAGDEA